MSARFRFGAMLALAFGGSLLGSTLQARQTGATPNPVASPSPAPPQPSAPITRAVAVMRPTQGSSVAGEVTFTQSNEGLRVSVRLNGLTPGKHGFHVHEYGDCSAPDGLSSGGHFNPTGHAHGGPDAAARHAGDFGNVEADAQGVVAVEYTDRQAALAGERSILGRGLIVHAKPDDLTTQPTGNAGGRLACGVIGAAK